MSKKQAADVSAQPKKESFFDPEVSIKKGLCGFEGCKCKIMKACDRICDEDMGPLVSCPKHHDTFWSGYRYMDEKACQTQYGQELSFQTCFNNSHEIKLGNVENPHDGHIATGMEGEMKAKRKYGAYNASAPIGMLGSTSC